MTLKRLIFLILGCLCLGLGCVGIVLPILPTVPFSSLPCSASPIHRRSSTTGFWARSSTKSTLILSSRKRA